MKKVICVDAKTYIGLTTNKGYPVISETENEYEIIDDNGDIEGYDKRHFRLVPEAEFQYGQEVEVSNDGKNWVDERHIYIAPNPIIKTHHTVACFGGVTSSHRHIRPVQSVRDKVIHILKTNGMPTQVIEGATDKIIELVKNEKK